MQKSYRRKKGFTLIEILVVIGIIAVLASVVLVAVNPARQFKLARDSQRVANVNAILNAIGQNISENKGQFVCAGTIVTLPAVSSLIKSDLSNGVDIANCLIPAYISSLPFDPSATGAKYASSTNYDTGYRVSQNTDGKVTVEAIGELTNPIAVSR